MAGRDLASEVRSLSRKEVTFYEKTKYQHTETMGGVSAAAGRRGADPVWPVPIATNVPREEETHEVVRN